MTRARRQWRRDDSGQISVLIAGYLLVALLAVAVAVDSSSLFLQRRSLQSVADGAALAVAHEIDHARAYAPTAAGDLQLRDDAAGVVQEYLADHRYDAVFRDLHVVTVSVSPDQVVALTLAARAPLPLGGFVAGDGANITVSAHARSHILGGPG